MGCYTKSSLFISYKSLKNKKTEFTIWSYTEYWESALHAFM